MTKADTYTLRLKNLQRGLLAIRQRKFRPDPGAVYYLLNLAVISRRAAQFYGRAAQFYERHA